MYYITPTIKCTVHHICRPFVTVGMRLTIVSCKCKCECIRNPLISLYQMKGTDYIAMGIKICDQEFEYISFSSSQFSYNKKSCNNFETFC